MKYMRAFFLIMISLMVVVGAAVSESENNMAFSRLSVSNVSAWEQEEIASQVFSALNHIRVHENYVTSYGFSLFRIKLSSTAPVIRKTRQRNLYTYYIEFKYIRNYIGVQALNKSDPDVISAFGYDALGLSAVGQLCIYYDSSAGKIVHIDSTEGVESAVLAGCNLEPGQGTDGLDYTTASYTDYIGSCEYTLDYAEPDQDHPIPVKAYSGADAVSLLKRFYRDTSKNAYNVRLIDSDGFNRFIFSLNDPLTDETVYIVYFCIDTEAAHFIDYAIRVGSVDTALDVLPCDDADMIIDKCRTGSSFKWGQPVWIGPPVTETDTPEEEREDEYGIVIADKVNMREAPSFNAEKITAFSKNTLLKVLGTEEAEDKIWVHAYSDEFGEGYIVGDYINILTPDELEEFRAWLDSQSEVSSGSDADPADGATNQQPDNSAVITDVNKPGEFVTRVNYRKEPRADSEVLGVLPENTKVWVCKSVTTDDGKEWYLVLASEYGEGYVVKDFVRIME